MATSNPGPGTLARRHAGVGLLLALAAGAAPARAGPAWTSGTFVYADLCTEPGTGARTGRRVTLRRSPNGDGLTYQGAGHAAPLAAGAMTLDDATRTLDFAVETGAGRLRFHGIVGTDALTGTFADDAGAHPVRLPRVLRSHADETCPGESLAALAPRG